MLSTTEETQNYRKAFHSYYYKKIQKDLASFEEKRKPALLNYWLLIIASALTFCSAFVYIFFISHSFNRSDEGVVKLIILIACAIYYAAYRCKKAFEKEVKTGVINSFLSFFGNFHWSMDEYIPIETLEDSGLTGSITSIENDDYFNGSHDDVGITISEMKLIRGSGKYATTIFDGLFIKLDMHKKMDFHTIITEHISFGSRFCSSLPCSFDDMEKVELEDPDFNKQFSVFSQDQTEARYILTTSFMERFKHLKEMFNTNNIRASFQNNSVLIGVNSNKDLFVLGDVTKPVTDSQEVQTLFEQFAAVLSLIEILKLNMKTGL